MANLLIKPTTGSGNKVIIQDQVGGNILTSADSGATIENITMVKLTPTTTANAPAGTEGAMYYDSDKNSLMVYKDSWQKVSKVPYSVEYLVIAGGGSTSGYYRSGGGGAGGYRNSYASETSGRNASSESAWTISTNTQITCTVGAGATNPTSGPNVSGNRGTDSSITAIGQTTVTSHGGGGGGAYADSSGTPSGTFGSGGGAGHDHTAARTGATGTAGHGFDGGDTPATAHQQGGGGGGASADGADGGTTSDLSPSGGNGLSSSITGSAVTRAGGGGGGSYGTGGFCTGGTGGGGNGGSTTAGDAHSGVSDGSYYYPTSGTEPVSGNGYVAGGGGGGLAGATSSGTYGKGATGLVILRMATSDYTGIITGSPVVSTTGTDTVLIFTGTGTYTS